MGIGRTGTLIPGDRRKPWPCRNQISGRESDVQEISGEPSWGFDRF
jgi:hypothetical protein